MLRRNVLIFHSAALGDFVLTWPLALALARCYAQSRIFYVTAAEKGKLAERVLGVESRDVESGYQHLFGDPAKLPDPARRSLEGAQLIVNLVAADSDPWTTNARDASRGAEILTLRPRPTAPTSQHISQFLLDQLTPHKILHAATAQMLASINEKGAGNVRKGGTTILLHPGSGSRDKCWPVDRYATLAHNLSSLNHPVRILLGEVERERLSPADLQLLESAAPVTHLDTYSALLDQLTTARAFVGNDSGPGHLAAVIGLPTVTLFGPTDPAIWHPLGPRVHALAAYPRVDAIPVADVLRATQSALTRDVSPAPSATDEE